MKIINRLYLGQIIRLVPDGDEHRIIRIELKDNNRLLYRIRSLKTYVMAKHHEFDIWEEDLLEQGD